MRNKNDRRVIVTLLVMSSLFLINGGGSESNVNDNKKQNVNFSGKVVTYQGQEYTVDNISIDGKYKKIPMFDLPVGHEEVKLNAENKQKEITIDPAIDLIESEVNLSESSEFRVPTPDIIWVQHKKGRQRQEFLEIDIISNVSNTKRSYLLERKTRIYCDELDLAGPLEKRIPLSAVKQLVIEGYAYRNTNNTNACKVDAPNMNAPKKE